jgi:folate-binding protein YgfZ
MSDSEFLTLPGAVDSAGADAGVPAHYGNPVAEQKALEAGAAIVDLSNRGVVSVTGPDRLSWLDSVTSQRIAGLKPGESAESLLLSVEGRVEHALRLVDDGVTVWILVDAFEVEPLVAWLDRMRFMLRVEVADRTAEYATIGSFAAASVLDAVTAAPNGVPLVWLDPWSEVVAGGHQYSVVTDHPGASWSWRETLVARAELATLVARVAAGDASAAGFLAAEALRIAAWRPRVATEGDEKTLPHELDWIRSAVHLSKGCYRGQETVAKVHNLGHPPRRLVFLNLDGTDNVLPSPGDDVVVPGSAGTGGEQPGAQQLEAVGHITSSALHYELGPIALAVVKRTTPVDVDLGVRSDGIVVAAGQETIVPPDAGAVVGRIRRMPRLGVQRR